jgi:hypothetical protein
VLSAGFGFGASAGSRRVTGTAYLFGKSSASGLGSVLLRFALDVVILVTLLSEVDCLFADVEAEVRGTACFDGPQESNGTNGTRPRITDIVMLVAALTWESCLGGGVD